MKRLSQFLIFVGLMLWPMHSYAQSDALTEAIEQGGKLYQAERYQEARPWLEKAIDLSESEFGPNDPSIAKLLTDLAAVYWYGGLYAEAEPLYKRSLAIDEKALGPEHPSVAVSLNNLAALYEDQGRYAEAIDPIRRASAILGDRALRSGGTRLVCVASHVQFDPP